MRECMPYALCGIGHHMEPSMRPRCHMELSSHMGSSNDMTPSNPMEPSMRPPPSAALGITWRLQSTWIRPMRPRRYMHRPVRDEVTLSRHMALSSHMDPSMRPRRHM